jgi:hypothetical protein
LPARTIGLASTLIAHESRGGVTGMADAMVNAVRKINLGWIRLEIGLLVGALMMGG